MRTSGSQLVVLGEFRRSLFDGAAKSRLPLLRFLDTGMTAPEFLVEPSMGPKDISVKTQINYLFVLLPTYERFTLMGW